MKKNYYTNNKYILEVLIPCRDEWIEACKGINDPDLMPDPVQFVSNDLAKVIILICDKLASRGNFRSYTFIDDMKAEAYLSVCRACLKFDPDKSSQPFSYLTQCCWNCFVTILNKEKKQRDIRDDMMINNGLTPSYTRQLEHEAEFHNTHDDKPSKIKNIKPELLDEMDSDS